MEIKQLPSAPISALKTNQASFLKTLVSGQHLNALVLNQLSGKGMVQLNLHGNAVRAFSARPLISGQVLALEVTRAGEIPQLKIIENQSVTSVIARNLRVLLPKQQSLKLFQNTLLDMTQNGLDLSRLPQSIQPIARNLINRLPSLNEMGNWKNIKQAVRDSGVVMEAKLNTPGTLTESAIHADLKINLLRLLALLKQPNDASNPNLKRTTLDFNLTGEDLLKSLARYHQEFSKETQSRNTASRSLLNSTELKALITNSEGALAKVLVDQFASIPGEDSAKQSWQLELPFHHHERSESVALKITRQEKKQKSHNDTDEWSVELELSPPAIGLINCKIRFRNGKVDTFFRSEREKTTQTIKLKLSELKSRYQRAGIEMGRSGATTGAIPRQSPNENIEFSLVDEKA